MRKETKLGRMKEVRRRSRRSVPGTAPTIKHVAEAAGVSTATVSRVLSGLAGVGPEISDRVREEVRKLGYQPNRVARSLRVRTTRTIGVIIPDIENPFFTRVVRGIEEVLQAAEYSLLLANSNESPARERVAFATLQAEGAAGVIFTAAAGQRLDYRDLHAHQLPMVSISRVLPGLKVDTVTVGNVEGARMAVAHLIGLGHRRIGLISGPMSINTARDRQAGYEKALEDAGLPLVRDLVQFADFRQTGGYSAMEQLLQMRVPPTAVFAGSNLMTLGALQAIHERGLNIPGEIAIVGFDDMPWAVSLEPPLTAVAQPAFEVGMAAARLILERLHEPGRPIRHIVLETNLVVRASCGSRQVRSSQSIQGNRSVR
jgi:DNA-binding LacI/PurR family transcriptional regulator